ncbi:MAG TPA: hypothetical protein VLH38_05640 [Patescibacteria group bacterium]|nr:hypothetical protein [Patescibacteria group bacterium]
MKNRLNIPKLSHIVLKKWHVLTLGSSLALAVLVILAVSLGHQPPKQVAIKPTATTKKTMPVVAGAQTTNPSAQASNTPVAPNPTSTATPPQAKAQSSGSTTVAPTPASPAPTPAPTPAPKFAIIGPGTITLKQGTDSAEYDLHTSDGSSITWYMMTKNITWGSTTANPATSSTLIVDQPESDNVGSTLHFHISAKDNFDVSELNAGGLYMFDVWIPSLNQNREVDILATFVP